MLEELQDVWDFLVVWIDKYWVCLEELDKEL